MKCYLYKYKDYTSSFLNQNLPIFAYFTVQRSSFERKNKNLSESTHSEVYRTEEAGAADDWNSADSLVLQLARRPLQFIPSLRNPRLRVQRSLLVVSPLYRGQQNEQTCSVLGYNFALLAIRSC